MMNENDATSLRARSEKLAQALKAAQAKESRVAKPPAPKGNSTAAAMSLAVRASSEIVAGVAVGAVLGWGLDRLFHTRPAFLILFLLLGLAAGTWNVVRATAPKRGD